MTESLRQQVKTISDQLIGDGYTDVHYNDESELLMATDPEGRSTPMAW